jgi:hypothetical protein
MFRINSIIKIIYFPHIEYIITMKCKLDVFTIFIILLIILVLFILLNKLFTLKERKETFIDFNKDNAENSSITKYIPQYSTDTTRTVIHLYDNLYFDNKNGVVLEVEGGQSGTNDNSGNSISQLHIIPRDGASYRTVQGKTVNNIAQPNDSIESKINTIPPAYDEYTYTTRTLILFGSFRYQFFYYSWNTQTFIHLFKYSILETASVGTTPKIPAFQLQYVKSYLLNPIDGLKYTNTASQYSMSIPEPTKIHTDFIYNDANNKNSIFLPNYLDQKVKVFQITPLVFYDIANGNIILKDSNGGGLKVYNRVGAENITPTNTGQPSQLTGQPTIFTVSNEKSGMVLVTSYYQNTIISVIIVDNTNSARAYKIAATQRFNKTQPVNDLASDPDNAAPTSAPTTIPASTSEKKWDKWNNLYDGKESISNCGSDPNCWYWFFKSLPSLKKHNDMSDMYDPDNGQSFISDDYFLKTEAVPQVCPNCPNCQNNENSGICTSCGGNGGSGTNINSCLSVSLKLTPIAATKYKDDLGNIYISTTDTSGNTRYILEGSATGTNVTNNASRGISSLDDNISGVANNAINTAGGVVGTAGNLAYSAGSGAVNLLKDTGSGAVDLLKDTGSGAVDLLKDTGSGAVDLLKGVGSGISNLGSGALRTQQGTQYNSVGGTNVGGTNVGGTNVGRSSIGSVSDKTFGKMPGQTPVDNYSYYGALQSKGGNFMPVTADFSSFRK